MSGKPNNPIVLPAVPEGRRENSPAFQRREDRPQRPSPEGTAEQRRGTTISTVPSGLDLRPGEPGIKMPGYFQTFLRNKAAYRLLKN
jgi:hypothetical protein